MDRFQILKVVVYILAALLIFELGMLIMMIRPSAFQLWASLGVLAVVCLYLVTLTLGLIKELKDCSKNKK